MAEGPFESADQSRLQLAAEEIVGKMLKERPGLIDEARTAFEKEPAGDLSKLLSAGESAIGDEAGHDEAERDEPEMIAVSDKDIETIMRELLEGNPEFAEVPEEVRRNIVTEAAYTVLAEEK